MEDSDQAMEEVMEEAMEEADVEALEQELAAAVRIATIKSAYSQRNGQFKMDCIYGT